MRAESQSQVSRDGPSPLALCNALRARVSGLHQQAESGGVIREILRGMATRMTYALYLRNLLPAYLAMEERLEQLREHPAVGPVADPLIYRATALRADLDALQGARWISMLELLPQSAAYANRIAGLSPECLLAHAYVRYLGDLSGGRVLAGVVAKAYGLDQRGLSFYAYPGIDDLNSYRIQYRAGLDRAGKSLGDLEPVLEEAAEAFRFNISVSEAVLAYSATTLAPPAAAS